MFTRKSYETRCEQTAELKKLSYSSLTTRQGGALGERVYSSYSFLTSALDRVSGQRHAPTAL
jgi:hypothetical protein